MPYGLGEGQAPEEAAWVVRQGEKLEADLVVDEVVPRQPRPFHRVLALLYPLLRRLSPIVERHVHSADGWQAVLEPAVARYRGEGIRRFFRGEAAFANPKVYRYLEAEVYLYAIRVPAKRTGNPAATRSPGAGWPTSRRRLPSASPSPLRPACRPSRGAP